MIQRTVIIAGLGLSAYFLSWLCLWSMVEAGSMLAAPSPSSLLPFLASTLQAPQPNPDSIFDRYMGSDIPPADGFDFPVGDQNAGGTYRDRQSGKVHHGWYIAVRFGQWYAYGIHPAEDWNGTGGTDTDLGQPVYAVARGRVVFAAHCGQPAGGVVIIQHVYYQNHQKRRIRSVYVHLDPVRVSVGDMVERRQQIGAIGKDPKGSFHAHLHLEFRRNEELAPTFWPSAARKSIDWVRQNYVAPSAFIRAHRQLFVPAAEPALMLVHQDSKRMRLYRHGKALAEFPVGMGKTKRQLDSSFPKGMYFVIDRHCFEFGGSLLHWEAGHRLVLNYPNRFDIESANLPAQDKARLGRTWQQRKATAKLAGSHRRLELLGWHLPTSAEFHSLNGKDSLPMIDADMRAVYPHLALGSMVVIF